MDRHLSEASDTAAGKANGKAVEVVGLAGQSAPVVFASPHSGRDYPPAFIAASRLDALALRRSEDSFVDEIFAAAPGLGAPLIKACFPRAYVDPNREAYELDPAMFDEHLPDFVNTNSARVAAGLGTVAKVVANGEEIYNRPLNFAETRLRIENYYRPYHDALKDLVQGTVERFGGCLLIDCHSMPSVGGPMDFDQGRTRVDFVLGDNHGASCAPAVTALAHDKLAAMGFRVSRNDPYSGGFTTREYGRPDAGMHVLQIEINRATYMNEATVERAAGMPALTAKVGELITALTKIDIDILVST